MSVKRLYSSDDKFLIRSMEVKLSSRSLLCLNADYSGGQRDQPFPEQNMRVFQKDFVKTRPSQLAADNKVKYNTVSEAVGTAKRLNSIASQSSLSEIDMEESGYLEGNSIFKNSNCAASGERGSEWANSVGICDPREPTYPELSKEFSNGIKDRITDSSTSFHSSTEEAKGQKISAMTTESLNNSFTTTTTGSKPNDMLSLSLSSSICSDESLEGELPNEHTRLTTVLNNIDPKRLHNYLRRKLKQNDLATILALSSLLPKKKFKAETLHCARCHLEYDPKHGDRQCRLFHRDDDVMKISEDATGTDFGCEHCGTVFRVEGRWKYKQSLNRRHNCGPCFSGKHTVSTDDVMYEPEGIAKTCEDYGCIVFYV